MSNFDAYQKELVGRSDGGLAQILNLESGQLTQNQQAGTMATLAKRLNDYFDQQDQIQGRPQRQTPLFNPNSPNMVDKVKRMLGDEYFKPLFDQLDSYIDEKWAQVAQLANGVGPLAFLNTIVAPFEGWGKMNGVNETLNISDKGSYDTHMEELRKITKKQKFDTAKSKQIITDYLARFKDLDEETKKELENELVDNAGFILEEHQIGLSNIIGNNQAGFKDYVKRIGQKIKSGVTTGMQKYERVKELAIDVYETIDGSIKGLSRPRQARG